MGRWLRALALLIACTRVAAAEDARPTLPATLDDVYGKRVDVAELAAKHRLVVVTLKATWCPVCRGQLERLRQALPRLRSCGATFIVLAPGPRDALRAVADATGFPYPFVEDRDLAIARAADLVLAPDQIVPAILVANAKREIVWMDRGRNPASFNDPALLAELQCPPDRMASGASGRRVGQRHARDDGRHERAQDGREQRLEDDEVAETHLDGPGGVERGRRGKPRGHDPDETEHGTSPDEPLGQAAEHGTRRQRGGGDIPGADLRADHGAGDERAQERQDERRADRIAADALLPPHRNGRNAAEEQPRDRRVEQQIDDAGADTLVEQEVTAMARRHATHIAGSRT